MHSLWLCNNKDNKIIEISIIAIIVIVAVFHYCDNSKLLHTTGNQSTMSEEVGSVISTTKIFICLFEIVRWGIILKED